MPLRRFDGLEEFPTSAPRAQFVSSAYPSLSFLSPSEYEPILTAAGKPTAALLGFGPLQRLSSGSPVISDLPHPTPSGSRVSHPLAVLRLPEPSGPVSCRWRSWGSPSGPFPLAEPWLLSEPVTFLALAPERRPSEKLLRHAHRSVAFKALLPARIRHFRRWS